MDNKLKYSKETGKTPTYLISVGFLANQPMATEDYTNWLESKLKTLEADNADLKIQLGYANKYIPNEYKYTDGTIMNPEDLTGEG